MQVKELKEGDRFYDLSHLEPDAAETVYEGLKGFVSYAFKMPDGTYRR